MPIYEYRCQDCQTTFEAFVSSIDQSDDVVCKKCNSSNIQKQLSSFSSRLASGSSSSPGGPMTGCSSKSGFS